MFDSSRRDMTQQRWPKSPPRGARCDCGKGVERDNTGQPRVIMCPNEAVETVKTTLGFSTWLCQECADDLVSKGKVQRNPRLRS